MPYTIREWNKLDPSIALLGFTRSTAKIILEIYDASYLKLLTRLRGGFSHLREHKFKHNFQHKLNPLCPGFLKVEDTNHFFMSCQNFSHQWTVLFDYFTAINLGILTMSENDVVRVLLIGRDMNLSIIKSSIRFINSFMTECVIINQFIDLQRKSMDWFFFLIGIHRMHG